MTNEESLKHFISQQKRYVREHDGRECTHYNNAISALRSICEADSQNNGTVQRLPALLAHPECRLVDIILPERYQCEKCWKDVGRILKAVLVTMLLQNDSTPTEKG